MLNWTLNLSYWEYRFLLVIFFSQSDSSFSHFGLLYCLNSLVTFGGWSLICSLGWLEGEGRGRTCSHGPNSSETKKPSYYFQVSATHYRNITSYKESIWKFGLKLHHFCTNKNFAIPIIFKTSGVLSDVYLFQLHLVFCNSAKLWMKRFNFTQVENTDN